LYAQSKLIMTEVISHIKNNNISLEQSILLNSARLSNYTAFEGSLPPKDKNFNKLHTNLAYTYSLLFNEIRPDNKNTPNLRNLLLNDPGNVGTFSKEIATVGISNHFDNHEIVTLDNTYSSKPYEYGIIVEGKLKFIEIKQYGKYYSSVEKIIKEYTYQKNKGGGEDLLLLFDYCAKNNTISAKDITIIKNLTQKLEESEFRGKIMFINSADEQLSINKDIKICAKSIEEDRIKKYIKFVSYLDKKDQNKLNGVTKLETGDFDRYQNDFHLF
jgi:hypothetical protein